MSKLDAAEHIMIMLRAAMRARQVEMSSHIDTSAALRGLMRLTHSELCAMEFVIELALGRPTAILKAVP